MEKIYLLLGVVFLSLIGCQESLEDTYSDFTGDGPVRYVGMCTGVSVESGWKRLTVRWENSLDPNIVNNKITCISDTREFDTLVSAAATECVIHGLEDASYEVKVQSVDDKGNLSLTTNEVRFGRPYTDTHEEVLGFTRGILKHFFVGNNLVLFYGTWNENIDRFWLEYTRTDGEKGDDYVLDQEEFAKGYALLEGVDTGKPIVLHRKGRLADCPDVIPFPDYTLTGEPVLRSDFKQAMLERYGETEFKSEFMNRGELELDYNLVSMEDILSFPKLEKLVLGKNRYMTGDRKTNSSELDASKMELNLFCLQVARNVLGLQIDRYNEHYFPVGTEEVEDKNDENLEDLEKVKILDTEGWTVKCLPAVPEFSENVLLDDNADTYWNPLAEQSARSFELTIDMGKKLKLDGLKMQQANVGGLNINFLPESMTIRVSGDGYTWTNPTYVENSTLGNAPGEITLIRFDRQLEVRYVRVEISEKRFNNSFGLYVGGILPFVWQ